MLTECKATLKETWQYCMYAHIHRKINGSSTPSIHLPLDLTPLGPPDRSNPMYIEEYLFLLSIARAQRDMSIKLGTMQWKDRSVKRAAPTDQWQAQVPQRKKFSHKVVSYQCLLHFKMQFSSKGVQDLISSSNGSGNERGIVLNLVRMQYQNHIP